MDKYIGRLLDNRYEILEVIGTGGMAVVYKARCHRLNRLVAIKILKDDYLEDEEFRRRFHSESQAVAMLSHPNIVSIYDVSSSITADYIVMELIDGITLKQYMEKKGILNWKETLHFAIQIAKALEHAHSKGIVHRDIKPHNIMVLKNGSVKVTDFGIARMMSKGNTLTKEALGSVHYISPEQAKGGRVDNRSDIYSLGVVMYEMMSGRPPYDGESPVAVAIQHINGGAVLPSTLNPNIPGGLEQIIMKAMSHEAADRYTHATQMLTDMDEFRKDPAILFDYNTPPTDAVTNLPKPPLVLEVPEVRTTADKVEQRTTGERRATPPERRRPQQTNRKQPARRGAAEAEKRSNNAAAIAIISCCLAMVVAIVVFLVVLFNGGTGSKQELVDVPNLIGQVYAELPQYPDFNVKIDQEVYDNTYPAGQIIFQKPNGGEKIVKNETIYVTVSLGQTEGTPRMPDLVDWELSQAERNLNTLNLKLKLVVEEEFHETIVAGNIIRTEPAADTELTADQQIKLYVSKGVEIKTSAMPDVIGDKKDSAIKVLESQKLDLDIKVEEVFNSVTPVGDVVGTEPAPKEELKTGQTVTVYVSKGPEMKELPDILNINYADALNQLATAGFTKYESDEVESDQDPYTVVEVRVDGKKVYPGNAVDINDTIIIVYAKPKAEEQITKDVVIDLRNSAAAGECTVVVLRDGKEVYRQTVAQNTATITIPGQKGLGPVKYVVVIDDQDGFDHWEEFVKE